MRFRGGGGAFARQHVAQISDIGRGLVGRQIGLRDGLGLGEAALQADDQREVLPHARIDRLMRRGAAQCRLGICEILRQRVGQAEIGQHGRLVRHDLERGQIMALRLFMVAELIEHRALRGKDVPIRLIGRGGVLQHLQCLLIVAGLGECATILAKNGLVVRIAKRNLLEHRRSLCILAGAAQRLRVTKRHVHILRIGAVLRAIDDDIAPQFGIRALLGGERNRIGAVGDLRGLAAGGGEADPGNDRGRSEKAGKSVGTHVSIAAGTPRRDRSGRAAGLLPAIEC